MPAARAAAILLLAAGASCGGSGGVPGGGAGQDGGGRGADAAPLSCRVAAADARVSCDGGAGCDLFLSCGCAAGDKCTVGTVGVSCAAAGPRAVGDSCLSDLECPRGTICAPFLGSTRCWPYCDAAHACPAGQACYVTVTNRGTPPQPLAEICGPTCSLLAQDCGVEGIGCYLSDRACDPERGICVTAGSFGQGTACSRMIDCRSGFLCIDPGGPLEPICAKICDRKGSGPPCSEGTTCRSLPGHTQTGICLP